MPYRLRNTRAHYRYVDKRKDEAPNPVLAASMKRLMAARGITSIGALRAAMAERKIKIGQGSLQKAVNGQATNRLETLEKIALFFDTTVDQLLNADGEEAYWPFSEELHEIALMLDDQGIHRLENVMRAHLGMEPLFAESVEEEQQHPHQRMSPEPYVGYPASRLGGQKRYPGLEDAQLPDEGHASTKHKRSTPSQGGGRGR